mmetsp:Transcript_12005/g.28709  ORF Transcript_12005/g.28709 Transcript_12005/m.28709 type:complete len:318 (+) Transcript_12005:284-1237(+)
MQTPIESQSGQHKKLALFTVATEDSEGATVPLTVRTRSTRGSGCAYCSDDFDGATKDDAMEREHSSSPETVILGVRRSSSHQWTESMDGMSRDSFELPFKPLLGLPEDCFLHVLRFLNVEQLCVAGGVNRQLRRLMDCDTLWRRHCLVDFGNDAEDIMEEYSQLVDSSEPAYYKRLYRSMIGFRVELRFWTGPRASEAIEVSNTKSTNIGRSRQNDICILQDEMVSRKHAQVAYKNKRYWLNDLGSINGTFINQSNSSGQKQIAKGQDVELGLHDEVEMGNSTFTVCLAPVNRQPSSAQDTPVNDNDTSDDVVMTDE